MSTGTQTTIAEYDKLIESGGLIDGDRPRVELIYGEVREMAAMGPIHEVRLMFLSDWSYANTPRDRVRIRVQKSLGIPALDSAPEPDLAWVPPGRYADGRPLAEDALLVIEVADSSLHTDRVEKGELYAQAGVKDYWIVNLQDCTVETYRKPLRGHYSELQTYAMGDIVRPLAFPKVELSVDDLFTYAG